MEHGESIMYNIEIRLAAKTGWHTPAEAKAYYGRYSRDGVTWHWWNTPNLVQDSDHDNIVNYILGKASRGTGSVNYVLSNTKITLLVGPDNVAWASQAGNPTTVSVELSPHLNAEGYKKAGWLFNELEGRWGKILKHYKHSDWYGTQCPGTISIPKIIAEAKKWKDGAYNPAPPPPPPAPVPSTPLISEWTLWKDGGTYVCNKQPTYLYDLSKATNWDTIVKSKTLNKGDLIEIVGSFKNTKLDRVYYVTRYSFDKKIATGFHPADLDIYAPPVVKPPEPPKEPEEPTDPVEPTDPEPPVIPEEPEEYPAWFMRFWLQLIEAIKNILGKGDKDV